MLDPARWIEAALAGVGLWGVYSLACVFLGVSFDGAYLRVWIPFGLWIGFLCWRPALAGEGELAKDPLGPAPRVRRFEVVASAAAIVAIVAWSRGWLDWWLCWGAMLAGVAMQQLARRGEPPQAPSRDAPRWRDGIPVALALTLALWAVAYVYRPDADDTQYFATAVAALEEPSLPLLTFDPVHGESGVPLYPQAYKIQTYEIFVAALSRLTGVSLPALYYLVLPAAWAALSVVAIWVLSSWFSSRFAGWITLLAVVVLIVWAGDPRSIGNFGFVRLFQGKAAFATALAPILIHCTLEHLRRPSWRSVVLLGLGQVGAATLSLSAAALAPFAIAAVLLSEAVADRARLKASLWVASFWLPGLLVASYVLWRSVQSGMLFNHNWGRPFDADVVLGGVDRAAVVLSFVVLAPLLVRWAGWRSGSWIGRYCLVGILLLLWSPPISAAMSAISLHLVSWRLAWVFPLTIAVASGIVAGTEAMLSKSILGRLAAAAFVLLALALFVTSGPWTIDADNGARRLEPTRKWKTRPWRAAARVVEVTEPDDLVLVAQPLSHFLPRLPGAPRLVGARLNLIGLTFEAQILDPALVSAPTRARLLRFASGRTPAGSFNGYRSVQDFMSAIEPLDLRAIVLDSSLDGEEELTAALSEAGFVRSDLLLWTLWLAEVARTEEPQEAPSGLE